MILIKIAGALPGVWRSSSSLLSRPLYQYFQQLVILIDILLDRFCNKFVNIYEVIYKCDQADCHICIPIIPLIAFLIIMDSGDLSSFFILQGISSSRNLLANSSDETPISSPLTPRLAIDSGKAEDKKVISKPATVQAVLKGIKQVIIVFLFGYNAASRCVKF